MDNKHSMISLKEKLAELLEIIPKQSHIVYADYPLYGNVGDLFIMKGTESFLKNTAFALKTAGILTIFLLAESLAKIQLSSAKGAEFRGFISVLSEFQRKSGSSVSA